VEAEVTMEAEAPPGAAAAAKGEKRKAEPATTSESNQGYAH